MVDESLAEAPIGVGGAPETSTRLLTTWRDPASSSRLDWCHRLDPVVDTTGRARSEVRTVWVDLT